MFTIIRAIFIALLLIMNIIILGTTFFLFAALKLALPAKKIQIFIYHIGEAIYHLWIDINGYILQNFLGTTWQYEIDARLNNKTWYMLIANHRSGLDILILQIIFNRKIPHLKFFMKDSLQWIPFIGQACYVLDYPIIKRYSHSKARKNSKLLQQSRQDLVDTCKKLQQRPTTVINFLEGTRFSEKKHLKSPYKYLLPPQAGGTAVVMTELKQQINQVIDVTIYYPQKTTLFSFLLGKVKNIKVEYDLITIDESWHGQFYIDRQYRAAINDKIKKLWQQKDNVIAKLQQMDIE